MSKSPPSEVHRSNAQEAEQPAANAADDFLKRSDFSAARELIEKLAPGRGRAQIEAHVDILQWHATAPRRALGLVTGPETTLRHIKVAFRCEAPLTSACWRCGAP